MSGLPTFLEKDEDLVDISPAKLEVDIKKDETILWEGQKNIPNQYVTVATTILIFLLGILSFLYGVIVPSMPSVVFSILTVIIVGVIIVRFYLELKNTRYVLTDKSVYVQKGLIKSNVTGLSMEDIDGIFNQKNIAEEMLNFTTIDIHSDSTLPNLRLESIKNANEVRKTIEQNMNSSVQDD